MIFSAPFIFPPLFTESKPPKREEPSGTLRPGGLFSACCVFYLTAKPLPFLVSPREGSPPRREGFAAYSQLRPIRKETRFVTTKKSLLGSAGYGNAIRTLFPCSVHDPLTAAGFQCRCLCLVLVSDYGAARFPT